MAHPDAIALLCDPADRIRAVLRDGGERALAPGMPFTDIFHPGSRARARSLLADARAGRAAFARTLNVCDGYRIRRMRFNAAKTGEHVLVVGADAQEAADAAFEWSLKSARPPPEDAGALYDRLSEVNNRLVTAQRDLAKQNGELTRLLADRARIAAMAAHDLRSPLQVITNSATALGLALRAPAGSREAALLGMISRSGEKMLRLVNDLLAAYGEDIGKLPLAMRRVDLEALARANVEANRALAAQKGITLSLHATPPVPAVLGDPGRLEQVLDNLVHNAIKFSPRDSAVRIELGAAADEVVIAVEDQGPGASAETLAALASGAPVASRPGTEAEPGFGLGLAIVRSILERHRGTIRAEAVPGRGTRFSIRLPAYLERS